MPYTLKLTSGDDGGIQVNYPNRAVAENFIFNAWLHDISLETTEGIQPWQFVDADDLSVSIAARSKIGGGGAAQDIDSLPQNIDREYIVKAHIILSIIAWNVAGVASVMIMRYLVVFRSSSVARYGSIVLSLLCFGMAVAAVVYTHVQKSRAIKFQGAGDSEDVDWHFNSTHTIIGLAVLIATGIHLILNLVLAFGINGIPLVAQPILVALCALVQVAAVVTSFFGFVEMDANIWMYLAYGVWIASVIAIAFILEALIRAMQEALGTKTIEMQGMGSMREPQQAAERRDSKAQVEQLANVSALQRYKNLLHALVVALVVSSLVFGALVLPTIIFTSPEIREAEEPVIVNNTKPEPIVKLEDESLLQKRTTLTEDENCSHPIPPETSVPSVAAPVVINDTNLSNIGSKARGVELGAMRVTLVQGSPYITAKYGSMTPKFRTQHAILSVNGQGPGSTVRGKEFLVKLNNGQSWLIIPVSYSSSIFEQLQSDIELSVRGSSILATSKFTGAIRVALVPSPNTADKALSTLKQFAFSWPVGGEMAYTTNGDDTIAYMNFNFGVESIGGSSSGAADQILMTALPHHRDNFIGDGQTVLDSDLKYQTIKGQAIMVAGNIWTIEVPLVSIGFFAPRSIAPNRRDAILQSLRQDIEQSVPIPSDTYSFGKVASRFARLALIADELGEIDARDRMVDKVIELLDPGSINSMETPCSTTKLGVD